MIRENIPNSQIFNIAVNIINIYITETFHYLKLWSIWEALTLKSLSLEDKLFFFEKNFFTLDGLWIIETEKETTWERALNIDLIVWKKMLKIIFRRLKKYLNIKTDNLIDFMKIFTFRWSVEGWFYDLLPKGENKIEIRVKNCPYYAAMERNPDRHDKIPLICKNLCIPLYDSLANNFNDEIKLERNRFKGLGNHICSYIFSQNGLSNLNLPSKIEEISKKDISKKDKLFYFEKNFRSLDGLWFIEVENNFSFETALKLDILVWQDLYEIIFRRVIKYLNTQGNSLKDLINILSFVWNCEGNYHEIIEKSENEILMNITKCPYIEAMERNPERHNRIKSICKDMCVPYLEPVLKKFNPNIILKREKFIGMGDEVCDFQFLLK